MSTPLNLVTLLPTAFLGLACYQRRRFWRHRGFAAANYGLASIALGCLLISPTHNFIGDLSGHLTDIWRADLLLGLSLIMLGVHMLILHLADTLSLLDEQMAQTASTVLTGFIVALWIGFFIGGLDDNPYTGEFPALGRNFFWGIFCIWLIFVCTLCIGYANTIIRLAEEGSSLRRIACWYRIAAYGGVLVGSSRIINLLINTDHRLPEASLAIDYTVRAAAIAALGIAATVSFRQVTKPLVIPDCWPPRDTNSTGSDDALAE
ncbi:membrane protein [Gordonia phage Rabbitrun]|uniref:Membrane protein n=1 Tax=Gordonia phage Rabbitrun TaxID=2762280 RepID=A0A7G8LIL3_9CAUD|nr:membrane protein [Gordonia phage Rabbitrun]QNJ57085.1 membrane protein [Gordonia phage Rabbitrun]